MVENGQWLAIIPARGGSKGIPGKNMRLLHGMPMIAYSVLAARESEKFQRIVVSSDDPAILHWASTWGVEVQPRPEELAGDEATIADVAADLVASIDWQGLVCVLQPTSPLRSAASIVSAIDAMRSDVDSLSTVCRERHLYWQSESGDLADAAPLFTERINRQFTKNGLFAENGSIQLVKSSTLTNQRTMVGQKHQLLESPAEESIDVDTHDDLAAVERRMAQFDVIFRLTANERVGSGHLYHCLRLAEELSDQRCVFALEDCDQFAENLIESSGRAFVRLGHADPIVDRLQDLSVVPNRTVIVNDVLDTESADILAQKAAGYTVVTIEDLGQGSKHADLVINALYPPDIVNSHVKTGPEWATLRTEFIGLGPRPLNKAGTKVLLTFGGTDPGGFGERFGTALALQSDLQVTVVVGPGAAPQHLPESVEVIDKLPSMAAAMRSADIVVTSAGRTVFEAAATGSPVVVVAQNAREATHCHLSLENGVLFAGLGAVVDDDHLVRMVSRLSDDFDLRAELSAKLLESIDHKGARRIARAIRDLMER